MELLKEKLLIHQPINFVCSISITVGYPALGLKEICAQKDDWDKVPFLTAVQILIFEKRTKRKAQIEGKEDYAATAADLLSR